MLPVQSQKPARIEAGPATSRLFFALWPDDPVRREIYAASRRAVERCGGKPIPPENFHITLAFLGSVPAERVDAVTATAGLAASSVRGEVFLFELDRFGHWPGSKVVWFGSSKVPPEVPTLARQLRERLRLHGLKPDGQRFVPHLTLARWVQQAGSFETPAAIRWTVREFVLVRSVSRPGGVDYTLLGHWPFFTAREPQASLGF